jgi:hypothetical protein
MAAPKATTPSAVTGSCSPSAVWRIRRRRRPPVTVQVRAGGELIVVETDHGAVRAKPGRAMAADASQDGPPDLVLAVLRGELSIAEAGACGVWVGCDVNVLARLVPARTSPAADIPATTHEGDDP